MAILDAEERIVGLVESAIAKRKSHV